MNEINIDVFNNKELKLRINLDRDSWNQYPYIKLGKLYLGCVTYFGRHYDYHMEGTFFDLLSYYESDFVRDEIRWSKKIKVVCKCYYRHIEFLKNNNKIGKISSDGLIIDDLSYFIK